MLKALYEVVSKAGGNMGEVSKASIMGLVEGELDEDDGEPFLHKYCRGLINAYQSKLRLLALVYSVF